jgi:hypothetical protein
VYCQFHHAVLNGVKAASSSRTWWDSPVSTLFKKIESSCSVANCEPVVQLLQSAKDLMCRCVASADSQWNYRDRVYAQLRNRLFDIGGLKKTSVSRAARHRRLHIKGNGHVFGRIMFLLMSLH